MKNFDEFEKNLSLTEGEVIKNSLEEIQINEKELKTSEEIAGYENAIVLYLNDEKRNLPAKIKWINSIAKEVNCTAKYVGDNIVIITDDNGDKNNLENFKKEFDL